MSNDLDQANAVISLLDSHLAGVGLAMVSASLRVLGDSKESKMTRLLLEATTCGALSLTASQAIVAMGLNSHWAVAAGGAIGYLGSSMITNLFLKLAHRKLK